MKIQMKYFNGNCSLIVLLILLSLIGMKSFVNYTRFIKRNNKVINILNTKNFNQLTTFASNNIHNYDILALDFDGVICASSKESSSTAVLTAKQIWNEFNNQLNDDKIKLIISVLQLLRPIIETGYESIILVRYISDIYDEIYDFSKDSNEQSNLIANLVQQQWKPQFRDKLITKYNSSKDALVKSFGDMRDHLIKSNLDHWINLNEIYPGVGDVLKPLKNLNYNIVTTKQERYVKAILQANYLPFPNNIYDLENPYGNKVKVLEALSNQWYSKYNRFPSIHFVEDRYETLELVSSTSSLNHVSLYLVDWGYNTIHQRSIAQSSDRIQLIG